MFNQLKNFINKSLGKKDTSSFAWRKWMMFRISRNKIMKSCLSENVELKDKYQGKRCFILGNGPSLNELDFQLLKDEYVFTVNMLMDHERFSELDSNFHVMVDAEIFKTSKESGLAEDYYSKKLSKLYDKEGRILFVPASVCEDIRKSGVNEKITVKYIEGYNYYNSIGQIELNQVIPAFNKVIQYAIAIASYMGFGEIYLLGCEETNVLPYINLMMYGTTSNDHCYKESEEVKASWQKRLNSMRMSWLFEDQAMVFRRYELLAEYCSRKDIKLVNLTEKSIIDSIKKDTLENVLNGKNRE